MKLRLPNSSLRKRRIRRFITEFCLAAERARLKWAYVEVRPYSGLGVAPGRPHKNDCSSFCALAFFYACNWARVLIADPLGRTYNSTGNTDSAYAFLKAHPAPKGKYLVGDMAIFGTPEKTVHMILCRKKGNATTAIFTSNGHESFNFPSDAPNPITLNRAAALQPLVGVFRHPALL